MVIEDATAMSW